MYYHLFDITSDRANHMGITVDFERADNPSVPYINTRSTSHPNPTAALPLAASHKSSYAINNSIGTSEEPSHQDIDQEKWPYCHTGIFLPVQSRENFPSRVTREWPRIHDNHVASDGFLLVDFIQVPNYVLLLQSIRTGDFLVHKFINPSHFSGLTEPAELRISTWQDTLPSVEFPGINPLGVLPQDAPFFNKLKFWQQYSPDADAEDQATTYSLYFE